MSAEKTVFISYRRDVSSFIARAIFQDLREHGYDVFMDVESIDSGQFDTIILNQIAARAHFLVILTPGTLERCAEPGDWLRREIEQAIELQRNIVPVMANHFSFAGTEAYLTGKLGVLTRYSGLSLPYDYFDAAMERLRSRFLKQPIYAPIQPTPPAERAEVQRRVDEAAHQPAPTPEALTAEQYFNRGYECDETGDYEAAVTHYTEAIRLNPQFAAAYNNRGVARKVSGDLDGAVADYTEALRLNPQYVAAYNNRGNARRDQHDYAGAVADYTEAIRLNPQSAPVYNNRGTVRKVSGDLAGAMADYEEAIRLSPQDATAYFNRGVVHYARRDYAETIADYGEVIRLDPLHAIAYNNRGEAHFALEHYEQAWADFKKSNDLRPGFNFALAGLAITRHVLKDHREAKRLWNVLIGMDSRYRDVDWVQTELNWADPLVGAARDLIAGL